MNKKLAKKLKNIDGFEPYECFVQRTMLEIEQELQNQGYEPSEIHQAMQDFGLFQWQQNTSISLKNNKPNPQIANKSPSRKRKKNSIYQKLKTIFLELTPRKQICFSIIMIEVILFIISFLPIISPIYPQLMLGVLISSLLFMLGLYSNERIEARFALFVFSFLGALITFAIFIPDIIDGEQYQKITDFRIESCNLEYRKSNEKYLCVYANDPEIYKLIDEKIGKVKILRVEADKVKYMDLYYYAHSDIMTGFQVVKK